MDTMTGKVNEEKLKENPDIAIDAYIHRVDKAPCGDTSIHLYKGPLSEEHQRKRAKLPKFFKSKKSREELKCEYMYVVSGRPPSFSPSLAQTRHQSTWGGTCSMYKDFCSGHYCKPCFTDVTDKGALEQVSNPPSIVLKQFFAELEGISLPEEMIEAVAKRVMLPTDEVKFWLEHLGTVAQNRKRGAAKAAETRRCKQQTSSNTSSLQQSFRTLMLKTDRVLCRAMSA